MQINTSDKHQEMKKKNLLNYNVLRTSQFSQFSGSFQI